MISFLKPTKLFLFSCTFAGLFLFIYLSGLWVLGVKMYYSPDFVSEIEFSWPYGKSQISGVYVGVFQENLFLWTYFGLRRIPLRQIEQWTTYQQCDKDVKVLRAMTGFTNAIQTVFYGKDMSWVWRYRPGDIVVVQSSDMKTLRASLHDYVFTSRNTKGYVCLR